MNMYAQLSAPFDTTELKFRAGATTKDKSRAIALPYIDSRNVMQRLDDVIGSDNWHDAYSVIHCDGRNAAVECRLTINGVTKSDVGTHSTRNDGKDFEMVVKGAYSDALKRAAVKFGIGRYLYDLPTQWVAYDAKRRQLAEKPRLPQQQRPLDNDPIVKHVRQKAREIKALAADELLIYGQPSAFMQTAVDNIARYEHPNAVKNALKLMGYSKVPGGSDAASERVEMYRKLQKYAALRDSGVEKEIALMDVAEPNEVLFGFE